MDSFPYGDVDFVSDGHFNLDLHFDEYAVLYFYLHGHIGAAHRDAQLYANLYLHLGSAY